MKMNDLEKKSHRILTATEENNLFAQYECGDLNARDLLVTHNTRFVAKLVREFLNCGLPYDDLMQEGMIGLLEAIEKFDRTKGFRFTTFAAFSIRQSMIMGLRRQANLVRLPQRKCHLVTRLIAASHQFVAEHGYKPQVYQLATILGENVYEIEMLSAVAEGGLSLDQEHDEFDLPMMQSIADTTTQSPRAEYDEECKRVLIDSLLKTLPPREEKLIRARYGLTASGEEESLRSAGHVIGVSQEGARRIEHKILAKLGKAAYRRQLTELV